MTAQPLTTPAGGRTDPLGTLCDREEQVLRLVAQGYVMTSVAAALGMSEMTVRTYMERGMEMLGLGIRADVVRYGVARGWVHSVLSS